MTRLVSWDVQRLIVNVQTDLTTTHNEEYAMMSVPFLPPTWNKVIRLSAATPAFPGTHTARDIEKFVNEVDGDIS